jgi:hypothetical protein
MDDAHHPLYHRCNTAAGRPVVKSRLCSALACAALAWLCAAGPAWAGSVSYYRYNIDTCTPGFEFAQPVSPGVSGTYYAVERDSGGRVVALTTRRGGKTLARFVYHYPADSQRYSSTDNYSGAALTGRNELKYNSSGFVIRIDHFDTAGARTGYTTVDVVPQGGTENLYTAAGRLRAVYVYRCSAAGRMVRLTRYANPADRGSYSVFDYSEDTGLSTLRQQYREGHLELVISTIYDGSGDPANRIGSTPDGTVVLTEDYSNALRIMRRYVEPALNAGLELHDHYNDKQWLDGVGVYFMGTLVCQLKYQMTSDGTVKKTLALGPDGSLWAEYPDQLVYDIDRDGTPVEGYPMVRHKTGDWW